METNGVLQQCTCGWIGLAPSALEADILFLDHNFDAVTSGHVVKRNMRISNMKVEDFSKLRESISKTV